MYFTLDECAEILNVDKSTVSRRLSKSNLETIKDGKRMYVPYETLIKLGATKEQIDAFIQRETQPTSAPAPEADKDDDEDVDQLLKEVLGDINVQEFNSIGSKSPTAPAQAPQPPKPPAEPIIPSTIKSKKTEKAESKSSKSGKADVPSEAVKPVAKLLGDSYSSILKPTLESLEWWNTAKELISWHAIMIALQVAKVDPAEIVRKAEEFQDPVKFANYIRNLLSAMVEAIEDAQAIQQYREELEDAYTRLKAYKVTIELQNRKIMELTKEVQTLLALLKQANEDMFMGYVMAKGLISAQMGGVEVGGSPAGSGEETG